MAKVTLDLQTVYDERIEYDGDVPPIGTVLYLHEVPEEQDNPNGDVHDPSTWTITEYNDRSVLVKSISEWDVFRDRQSGAWETHVTLLCVEV